MKFKELLKNQEMTQEQLAKKLNVTQQTISAWVCGSAAPKRECWSKVAKILDVTVEQLLDCFEK